MKRINNKGFTLVEVLAVVAILGMVMVIMIPNVSNFLAKEKDTNIERLKKSIIQAGKLYVSDNKYDITLDNGGKGCPATLPDEEYGFRVIGINGNELKDNEGHINGHLKVADLINNGYLTTDKNGQIKNPKNDSQCLELDNNYLGIIYMCNTKDYKYSINEKEELNNIILNWVNC